MPSVRLIVLGKQGAGKGTQCVRLSHHYVVPHISTGDMLRAAVKSLTPLGLEAQRYMDAGELIPDEVVLSMVAERFAQDDTKTRGFILDGFPRTVIQAEMLEKLLEPLEIDGVVNLTVATHLVMRRLAARRVCVDCGTNYSAQGGAPRVNWICDVCGGEVIQRDDDTEAAIQRRLDIYEMQTAPLISRYREQGKLIVVRGDGTPDSVSQRLIAAVDKVLAAKGDRP